MNPFKITASILLSGMMILSACKKETYKFGEIKTPEGLQMSLSVAGVSSTQPDGDGSGSVDFTVSASNALTYHIDFGDGTSKEVPSGKITYKYRTPGTKTYQVVVNAIGKGGVMSTVSQTVSVYVAFDIPPSMIEFLTKGSSRTWVTAKDQPGHFGVGPTTDFSPIWYAATPNSREACAYDDEITFTKEAGNTIAMEVVNKGESFSIEAATAFYGFSGKDGCYAINTGGKKNLAFMDASSGSTSSNSTKIQFIVPGNGIINFGTGATEYEILSISDTEMHLRSVGVTGLAWYMKLTPKP
ncbi:MAG: PKD domain-containing protein [Bacteroidia bacterium]